MKTDLLTRCFEWALFRRSCIRRRHFKACIRARRRAYREWESEWGRSGVRFHQPKRFSHSQSIAP